MAAAEGPTILVALADEALYTAKRSGRDRICIATGQAVPSQRSVSTVTNGNKENP